MPIDQRWRSTLFTWLQTVPNSECLPCCLVGSKVKRRLGNTSAPNIHVKKRRAMENGRTDWFPRFTPVYWHLPTKWPDQTNTRVLFLVYVCCLLCTSASSLSLTLPSACVLYNSSASENYALLSYNCSSLDLFNFTITFHAAKGQYRPNDTSTTTPDTFKESINSDASGLYYLDLSHNKLRSTEPDIQWSEESFNSTYQIQINTLLFSYNNITQVLTGHLSTYTSVQNLDLSCNHIEQIDADAFIGLGTLLSLNLSHNALEDLDNNTFRSLGNLGILDVSFNNLFAFPFSKLPVLSFLQYLHLNNNHLYSVTSPTSERDTKFPSLVLLDLSNNHLKEFPLGLLKTLSTLKTLSIRNNSIQNISEYSLVGLHNLEYLTLDQNEILAITKPVFQNTALVKLSIAFMPSLSNISHDAFLGLPNLIYLNLSHNYQVSFLQPNLFKTLVSLKVLDISSSNLSQISQITFHNNKNMQEIHLLNNPLSCSCTNAWLGKEAYINQSIFVNVHSLHCLNESNVQMDINNASFLCDELFIHNMSSRISAKLGSQLLFKCQHETDNPGVVMWITPRGTTFYQHHFHPEASRHLLTPEEIQPESKYHKDHYWHYTSSYHSELSSSEQRVAILSDGSLYIDYMLRTDAGPYKCQVSNGQYNHTVIVNLYVDCTLSSDVKIIGYITGIICALSFFTLNLIYVIISWTARRLVNKRRREIIRQMLENINVYKSMQIARIHENYTYQISRVRNQYRIQCERLYKNYTSQVTKMKRGCSNQVERVRDNYNSKLTQLRDYSSNQIMQIRERTNCQITRIRDYGASQLEKLRETYKLQQQHVLKLLDTMNLENCRNIVETECIRAESMMYDIDLLGDDDRTDSPTSAGDSEYNTAASSPSSSPEEHSNLGLSRDMSQKSRELSTGSSDNSGAIVEMQTTIDLEPRLLGDNDSWKYADNNYGDDGHDYLMNIHCQEDPSLLKLHHDQIHSVITTHPQKVKPVVPLPTLNLQKHVNSIASEGASSQYHITSDSDINSDAHFMTPEASPTKILSKAKSRYTFQQGDNEVSSSSTNQDSNSLYGETASSNNETFV